MNPTRCLLLSLALLSFWMPSTGWGQSELFSEDFESVPPGKRLSEETFWQTSHMTAGEVTVEADNVNRYAVSISGENEYCQIDSLPFRLTPASVVLLCFDLFLESEQSSAAVGIGPNGLVPAYAGVVESTLNFRTQNWGTVTFARSASGPAIRPAAGKWIRVQSRWDFADNDGLGSATLAMRDLDAEGQDFTPLYFDVAQSQEKVSLEIPTDKPVSTWGRIWFRLDKARIDNIRVEVE
jgi:hypothetical protein